MSLPITNLKMQDVYYVLNSSVSGTSIHLDNVCLSININKYGLNPTYCPGSTPDLRLTNLQTSPYHLSYFRGYDHNVTTTTTSTTGILTSFPSSIVGLSPAIVCALSCDQTYYHDGLGVYPDTGDYVYSDASGLNALSDGFYKYCGNGENWYQIFNTGQVRDTGNCTTTTTTTTAGTTTTTTTAGTTTTTTTAGTTTTTTTAPTTTTTTTSGTTTCTYYEMHGPGASYCYFFGADVIDIWVDQAGSTPDVGDYVFSDSPCSKPAKDGYYMYQVSGGAWYSIFVEEDMLGSVITGLVGCSPPTTTTTTTAGTTTTTTTAGTTTTTTTISAYSQIVLGYHNSSSSTACQDRGLIYFTSGQSYNDLSGVHADNAYIYSDTIGTAAESGIYSDSVKYSSYNPLSGWGSLSNCA